MDEKEFSLLQEPWIMVMKPDSATEEVSLLDLFRRAPEFKELAGELPTQDVAVLRLLLAILHAVFGRYDPDGNHAPISSPGEASSGEALKRWKSLWEKGAFPMGIIEDYLRHHEDRFWLFHPERPFYQVALQELVSDSQCIEIKPSEKDIRYFIGDIAESGNKARLFSGRTQNEGISYSEAARWLLYTNSFDVAPVGRPAPGSIKGYGISWLSHLGLVWAKGSNVFETLMLNLVIATENGVWNGCDASWEQNIICDAENLKDTNPVFPQNPCSLLSMQFRRMQLIRDKERKRVTKLLLWSGQALDTKNAFLEQMTLWQKRKEDEAYVPKRHIESRQIWRDFSAILSSSPTGDPRPGVVKWIAWLKDNGILQIPFIKLNTAGVALDKKNATVMHVFTDGLYLNLSLFTALGENWVNRIINEISVTEKLVNQVGWLAENLARAAGEWDKEGLKNKKNAAKEQTYFRLDTPFRRWLERINPERDSMEETCNQWREQARRIVRALGKELVAQSGPQAFVGRVVMDKKKKEQRYTAPEAYNQFLIWTSAKKAL
jgi:CRISPR system Cascade subunit CasA